MSLSAANFSQTILLNGRRTFKTALQEHQKTLYSERYQTTKVGVKTAASSSPEPGTNVTPEHCNFSQRGNSRFSTNKVMIKLMPRISFRSELLVNCLKFRDKFNFIFVILIY